MNPYLKSDMETQQRRMEPYLILDRLPQPREKLEPQEPQEQRQKQEQQEQREEQEPQEQREQQKPQEQGEKQEPQEQLEQQKPQEQREKQEPQEQREQQKPQEQREQQKPQEQGEKQEPQEQREQQEQQEQRDKEHQLYFQYETAISYSTGFEQVVDKVTIEEKTLPYVHKYNKVTMNRSKPVGIPKCGRNILKEADMSIIIPLDTGHNKGDMMTTRKEEGREEMKEKVEYQAEAMRVVNYNKTLIHFALFHHHVLYSTFTMVSILVYALAGFACGVLGYRSCTTMITACMLLLLCAFVYTAIYLSKSGTEIELPSSSVWSVFDPLLTSGQIKQDQCPCYKCHFGIGFFYGIPVLMLLVLWLVWCGVEAQVLLFNVLVLPQLYIVFIVLGRSVCYGRIIMFSPKDTGHNKGDMMTTRKEESREEMKEKVAYKTEAMRVVNCNKTLIHFALVHHHVLYSTFKWVVFAIAGLVCVRFLISLILAPPLVCIGFIVIVCYRNLLIFLSQQTPDLKKGDMMTTKEEEGNEEMNDKVEYPAEAMRVVNYNKTLIHFALFHHHVIYLTFTFVSILVFAIAGFTCGVLDYRSYLMLIVACMLLLLSAFKYTAISLSKSGTQIELPSSSVCSVFDPLLTSGQINQDKCPCYKCRFGIGLFYGIPVLDLMLLVLWLVCVVLMKVFEAQVLVFNVLVLPLLYMVFIVLGRSVCYGKGIIMFSPTDTGHNKGDTMTTKEEERNKEMNEKVEYQAEAMRVVNYNKTLIHFALFHHHVLYSTLMMVSILSYALLGFACGVLGYRSCTTMITACMLLWLQAFVYTAIYLSKSGTEIELPSSSVWSVFDPLLTSGRINQDQCPCYKCRFGIGFFYGIPMLMLPVFWLVHVVLMTVSEVPLVCMYFIVIVYFIIFARVAYYSDQRKKRGMKK